MSLLNSHQTICSFCFYLNSIFQNTANHPFQTILKLTFKFLEIIMIIHYRIIEFVTSNIYTIITSNKTLPKDRKQSYKIYEDSSALYIQIQILQKREINYLHNHSFTIYFFNLYNLSNNQ